MLRRQDDYSIISDNDLEKIASAVDINNKYKIYDILDEKSADIVNKQLKMQGYLTKTEKIGDKVTVKYALSQKVELSEAQQSGQFKKLAWGRYVFERQSSIGDVFKYAFDDGSVWKIMTAEDGTQYLIKEVNDQDEDDIVRDKKVLSNKNNKLNKTAAIIDINDENKDKFMQIIYHNSDTPNKEFLDDIFNSPAKNYVFEILTSKLDKLILEKLKKHNLTDETMQKEVLNMITEAINSNKILDEQTLDSLIYNYIQEAISLGQNHITDYSV